MSAFVHPMALCETDAIGEGTRIWAFAHVLPGASIGEDCNICDHVFIEDDVVVGDRVTVKCGVQLWDGMRVEDDVFIGPNATFTNDPFPRSKQSRRSIARTVDPPWRVDRRERDDPAGARGGRGRDGRSGRHRDAERPRSRSSSATLLGSSGTSTPRLTTQRTRRRPNRGARRSEA